MSEKEERKLYFRKSFYKKWGNYQNYLDNRPSKEKKKKPDSYLKVSEGRCPKCLKSCEVVMQRFREEPNANWFIIGYNCNCGFKQKACPVSSF